MDPLRKGRTSRSVLRLGVALWAAIAFVVTSSPSRADAPAGIYALGAARDNTATPQDERLAGIRNYDFVAGFTLRMFWSDLETAQGQYNFGVIDSAIQSVAAIGRGLNLEVLTGEEPQYVLDGASATYLDHRGGTNPVPWDPFIQQRHGALLNALATHVVPTPGGAHPLNQDPTLKSIDATPAGLNFGVRDINSGIRSHPDYTQQQYVDGVATAAAAFPNDTNFLAFFAFTDNQPGTRVDQQIIQRLAPLYNAPGQPQLSFFAENLSDDGPVPQPSGVGTGNNLLAWVGTGGGTMMQALDSWLQHSPDREPQLDSHNAATGIQLAYETYGTRFVELYVSDLDGASAGALDAAGRPIATDLRAWNAALTAVPEPALAAASPCSLPVPHAVIAERMHGNRRACTPAKRVTIRPAHQVRAEAETPRRCRPLDAAVS